MPPSLPYYSGEVKGQGNRARKLHNSNTRPPDRARCQGLESSLRSGVGPTPGAPWAGGRVRVGGDTTPPSPNPESASVVAGGALLCSAPQEGRAGGGRAARPGSLTVTRGAAPSGAAPARRGPRTVSRGRQSRPLGLERQACRRPAAADSGRGRGGQRTASAEAGAAATCVRACAERFRRCATQARAPRMRPAYPWPQPGSAAAALICSPAGSVALVSQDSEAFSFSKGKKKNPICLNPQLNSFAGRR
uniref:serine/arginine repetitive matrix protein 3-like n=1 Tax=Nyctereutes procyonoides TaxID=34880 RepID=UPI002444B63F|nr:serine/arginine repetitive matrix protein 3-like [Nyctereutes procyonoides]